MKSDKHNYTTYNSDTDDDDMIINVDLEQNDPRISIETLVTVKHSVDFSDFRSFGEVNQSTK